MSVAPTESAGTLPIIIMSPHDRYLLIGGMAAPTPTASAFGLPSSIPAHQGTILFDFTASSPFELSVSEGSVVDVLELDDGSGWVKIGDASGEKGLVPATYVQLMEDGAQPAASAGTIRGNKPQGGGKFGEWYEEPSSEWTL